jgi:DMSO reductase anchor subunit
VNLLHEWPLVIFTLASQVAVGSVLALLVVWGMLWRGGQGSSPSAAHVEAVAGWSRRPLLFVGLMTLVGLAASFLHLGAPLNALRALSNVGHSWLSREILAALAFLGLWILAFRLHRRPEGVPSWLLGSLALALALAGVLLIWTMARVYMLPARPLWDTWLTPASFFLAAVLLGITAVATHVERHPLPSRSLPTPGPAFSLPTRGSASSLPTPGFAPSRAPRFHPDVVLLSMALAAALAQLAVASFNPVTESLRSSGTGAALTNARILLLLAGALLITAALARNMLRALGGSDARGTSGVGTLSGLGSRSGIWTASALLLLLASETLGRMLFYVVGTADPF